MLEWVDSHGIEVIIGYLFFATLVGSMPPLPEGAGYWSRWAYGFMQLAVMNWRYGMSFFNVKVPQTAGKEGDNSGQVQS